MSPPIVEIVHRETFSAAHRLHSESLTGVENQELFGPCEHVHGHNYVLEVAVRGPVDPRTGMVLNLHDLMQAMRGSIIDRVDHRFLNEDVSFLRDLPVITTEALVIVFWERLAELEPGWGGAKLHRVRLMESSENFIDYYGPG